MNTQLQTTQSQSVAPNDVSAAALELALAGDLARLTIEDRLKYIARTCELVGLNPLTKPFDIMSFNGKTVLYPNKSCAEQLRKIHVVSVEIVERKVELGCLIVRCKATDGSGRHDEALAAVPFNEKNPEAAAIAMMKAETKAKRRVTFSICGLGFIAADIDHHDQTQTASTVVTTEHSAASLADKINSSLTAGEKAQAINIEPPPEPVAESVPVNAVPVNAAPIDVEIVTQTAAPAPLPATVPSNGLPDDVVVKLETILSGGDVKRFISYLIAKGKLKPMEGLNALKKDVADFIIKDPVRFYKMVADWQSK